MKIKQLKLEIFGRVQGVRFRQGLKKEALNLNIVGTVKNDQKGTVQAIAQGTSENLEKLLLWAQKGTPLSKVTGMHLEWSTEIDTELNTFEVVKEHNFILDQINSFSNLGKRVVKPFEKMNIPKHVVLIPDGNRRWARANGWKPWIGHKKGIEFSRIEAMILKGIDLKIKYFSLWGFSTENWDRHPKEIEYLWALYRENVKKWEGMLHKYKVRFRHFGRKDRLPRDIVDLMAELELKTSGYSEFNFQFCLDYGGRDDIVRAINRIISDGLKEVSEDLVSRYLDSSEIPDPDLIIRTSGEKRTSGIMAYQSAYAELLFVDKAFPEFNDKDLQLAVLEFSSRIRRFGGDNLKDFEGLDIISLKDVED